MEIYNGPYSVYCQQFPNGKFYVGITSMKPERRWRNGKGYTEGSLVRNAIDKYGWDNVNKEIIAHNLTMEEATNFERLLIEQLDLMNPEHGYNQTSGGEMVPGYYYSESTRKKQSDKKKGVFDGGDNPHAKAVVCVETGEIFPTMKAASSWQGFGSTAIAVAFDCGRTKVGGYHWRQATEEEAPPRVKAPPKSPLKGRKRPDLSGANSGAAKPVLCVETGIIYPTINEANIATGANRDSIRQNCNGKLNQAGGYHWKFVKENKEKDDSTSSR